MKAILIIDDEPLVRRSLARAFQKKNWKVLEAENGLQGLELWRQEHPLVAMVDVLMPVMSGPQLLENLSDSERRDTLILLMSAYAGKDYDLPSTRSDGFLSKPFTNIFEIVEKVEVMLNSKK